MNSELNNFINTPKLTNKSTDFTSYYGVDIKTTMKKLIDILGQPNGSSCSKVSYCWDCELSSGEVFTVYDWKQEKQIKQNDVVEFHIGGFNKETTVRAYRSLSSKLEEYNG